MALKIVAPTILTSSPAEYKEIIKRYYPFAKRVHIDISDATLAPTTTITPAHIWWPKGWTVDVHMMTATPSKYLEVLLKLHPNLVIFHAEAKEDLLPTMEKLQQSGIKVGVCIIKNIYPGNIKTILDAADHALIFSGSLGQYGGEADLLLLEKADLIQQGHPDIEIGWDGGANVDNIRHIAQGGVSVVNVGSALAKADNPQAVFEKLSTEIDNEEPF
ncbi:hypothetical protein IKF15_03130 [Candidatus Saccharibacteria bacterium]|nr:hypothetical protein [Candidatus Saccharibacteria bacterium]